MTDAGLDEPLHPAVIEVRAWRRSLRLSESLTDPTVLANVAAILCPGSVRVAAPVPTPRSDTSTEPSDS